MNPTHSNRLSFQLPDGRHLSVAVHQLVIAGWTGRDRAAIDHHIEELAALGVPRPSTVPLYYRVAASLITQAASIQALGDASSGEVEPVLVRAEGVWWLSVGSDHTDRQLEAHSVAASKQVCAKPVARVAWPWDELRGRADQLVLESSVHEGGQWLLYQQGLLARIRPLEELVAGLPPDVPVQDGLVMFCGTLGALPNAAGQGVRAAPAMRLVLRDETLGRSLEHEYATTALPVVA